MKSSTGEKHKDEEKILAKDSALNQQKEFKSGLDLKKGCSIDSNLDKATKNIAVQVGARVRVYFDDGIWYGGHLIASSTRNRHKVLFDDGETEVRAIQ